MKNLQKWTHVLHTFSLWRVRCHLASAMRHACMHKRVLHSFTLEVWFYKENIRGPPTLQSEKVWSKCVCAALKELPFRLKYTIIKGHWTLENERVWSKCVRVWSEGAHWNTTHPEDTSGQRTLQSEKVWSKRVCVYAQTLASHFFTLERAR